MAETILTNPSGSYVVETWFTAPADRTNLTYDLATGDPLSSLNLTASLRRQDLK